MWVATQDLPRTAAHPFYARLNQILDQHDFDRYVEGLTATNRWSTSKPSAFAVTSPSPIVGDATGGGIQKRAARCIAIVAEFAGHAACASCGSAVNARNDRLPISMRPVACAACTSAVTPTVGSGC